MVDYRILVVVFKEWRKYSLYCKIVEASNCIVFGFFYNSYIPPIPINYGAKERKIQLEAERREKKKKELMWLI